MGMAEEAKRIARIRAEQEQSKETALTVRRNQWLSAVRTNAIEFAREANDLHLRTDGNKLFGGRWAVEVPTITASHHYDGVKSIKVGVGKDGSVSWVTRKRGDWHGAVTYLPWTSKNTDHRLPTSDPFATDEEIRSAFVGELARRISQQ